AGAHGDADIGLSQGGGVIDAVAGHRHYSSLPLQFADDFQLGFGQDFGFEFIDAESLRDRFGYGTIVAGKHDDADTLVFESADGFGGGGLDRIHDVERPDEPAVYCDAEAA